MALPNLIRDPDLWQRECRAEREAGRRLALVPTMGFLHEGHLSLMREARRRADERGKAGLALATIFVNPSQFGPSEDLSRYPRDLAGDLEKCGAAGIDWVLAPESAEAMYPEGFQTFVEVTEVTQGLCGEKRPGHFRGVATVVAKLLNLTGPQVAIFGQKDYQQLQVLKRMARDLAFDVEIAGMPIVREPDGLAMSSRNSYLSPDERRRALALSASLRDAQELAGHGEREGAALKARALKRLASAEARVDYVEIVHPETLRSLERAESGAVMLLAAFFGKTRLIDNAVLP
jgi:pantoate--beta-alanine ligase